MNADHIVKILGKHLEGTELSVSEQTQLQQWVDASPANRQVFEQMQEPGGVENYLSRMLNENKTEKALELFEHNNFSGKKITQPVPNAHRVHFLRRSWFRYAAAVVLLLGAGTIAFIMFSTRRSASAGKDLAGKMPDKIIPGTNKAVLTVDNKQIDLASDKTGIAVGKEIAYNDGEKLAAAGQQLLLTTPNGGQYQLLLPDGTKAWLNAASSISFPAVFPEGKRQIKVTGEVYLEVAHDRSKPFFVDVDGHLSLQVLGTRFNVNSYADDGDIKTMLVEGSVRVWGKGNDEVILKPGFQAIVPCSQPQLPAGTDDKSSRQSGNITVITADVSQTLAWKNGIFEFNGANVKQVMKQLERWYNIKVEYSKNVPDIIFKGAFYRNVNLSDILKVLTEMGVQFRMQGRTLVVL